jgi:hypothetical protein
MVSLKSKHTGIDLPFPLPDAIPAVYLNSMFPDIAIRYWEILRTEAFAAAAGQLKPVLPKRAPHATPTRPEPTSTSMVVPTSMPDLAASTARWFVDSHAPRPKTSVRGDRRDEVDGALTH